MRLLLVTTLVSALAISTPVTLVANDELGIRNAAARAAANAQPDDESATARSGTSVGAVIRVLLGVTLIAGGAGLLALDPTQPEQPTLVSPVEIRADLNAEVRALQPTHAHTDRWLDGLLRTNYTDGVADGAALVQSLVWRDGRELYRGAFQPYRVRDDKVRYGGLAAIALGTALVAYRGGGGGDERRNLAIAALPGHLSFRASVGF